MLAAKELKAQGRGFQGIAAEALRVQGLRMLLPSFLWRSPLFDSTRLVSGGDRLHQDHLGPAKRLQRFLVCKNAPFGSAERGKVVNRWLSILRENGIAGLISDNKLFTKSTMQVMRFQLPRVCYLVLVLQLTSVNVLVLQFL
jgi:hypothetical protein